MYNEPRRSRRIEHWEDLEVTVSGSALFLHYDEETERLEYTQNMHELFNRYIAEDGEIWELSDQIYASGTSTPKAVKILRDLEEEVSQRTIAELVDEFISERPEKLDEELAEDYQNFLQDADSDTALEWAADQQDIGSAPAAPRILRGLNSTD
jgi:hypothetical protein